jgi:uncharacterized protein
MASALLILAAIYGGLTGLASLFQDHLISLPQTLSADAVESRAAALGLVPWPAGQADVRGFLADAPATGTKGTVIVFHGNAGTALGRAYYVDSLTRLGYRVILAEYPGYGVRPGKPSEQAIVSDAAHTVRIASRTYGPPLFLVGESLGAGVVAAAAAQNDLDIQGLVLITPWDTLPNMAQSAYWFLPARWLIRDRYDSLQNLKLYRGRTAVVLAAEDEIVPTRLTQNLYQSLTQEKRLWTLPGAGHNDWPALVANDFWTQVMGFLNEEISDPAADKATTTGGLN